MGRTARKRKKTRLKKRNINLGHETSIVNLKKWLKRNNFEDPLRLELRNFPKTGRGVCSKHDIHITSSSNNETLLRIPFNLLITFDTIRKSELIRYLNAQNNVFTIHTLLALFLVFERHKLEKSKWNDYLNALPYPEPVLPWTCKSKYIQLYPEDLKIKAQKLQQSFIDNFKIVKKSLKTKELCDCCAKPVDFLIDQNLFKWAYILVNTRAVYVEPSYVLANDHSEENLLADEPFLALCPYLDLINHHYSAKTKANVVNLNDERFYQLITLTGFKKYEEIFISYGAHSNEKLLMEYGFFIPGNFFDIVPISFKEVIDVLNINLNERQYKYIKSNDLKADDIYINENGASFVLKAILFVGHYPDILNYASYIFSNRYPEGFHQLITVKCTKVLLNFKLVIYKNDYDKFVKSKMILNNKCDDFANTMSDFLEYRLNYINKLLSFL